MTREDPDLLDAAEDALILGKWLLKVGKWAVRNRRTLSSGLSAAVLLVSAAPLYKIIRHDQAHESARENWNQERPTLDTIAADVRDIKRQGIIYTAALDSLPGGHVALEKALKARAQDSAAAARADSVDANWNGPKLVVSPHPRPVTE